MKVQNITLCSDGDVKVKCSNEKGCNSEHTWWAVPKEAMQKIFNAKEPDFKEIDKWINDAKEARSKKHKNDIPCECSGGFQ